LDFSFVKSCFAVDMIVSMLIELMHAASNAGPSGRLTHVVVSAWSRWHGQHGTSRASAWSVVVLIQRFVMFSGEAWESSMIFGIRSKLTPHISPVSGPITRSHWWSSEIARRAGHWWGPIPFG